MSMRIQTGWFHIGCAVCVAAVGLGCSSFQGARLYHSGTAALDRGDSVSAVSDLERAAGLLPEASEVQNHLGLAYQAEGRDREAELAFERAVALDCDNGAAAENLRVTQNRSAEASP